MKEWQAPVYDTQPIEGDPLMVSSKIISGETLYTWLDRGIEELGLPPRPEYDIKFVPDTIILTLAAVLHAAFERIEELQEESRVKRLDALTGIDWGDTPPPTYEEAKALLNEFAIAFNKMRDG